MSNECCSHGEQLIFTCAGAAYCGQLANRSGVQAMTEGLGKLFCLAAVSAQRDEKLKRARAAGKRLAIDGCEDDCARRTLEMAGLAVDAHVRVTDLGIEKQPAEPHWLVHTRRVVDKLREVVEGRSNPTPTASAGPSCGCAK